MRIVVLLVAVALAIQTPPISAQQAPGLRIVVIQGENAINVIQRKTAVRAVVEVRDRNNLPVPGATVTFALGGQGGASVAGAPSLTVITNASGQALLAGVTPTSTGTLQISVTASFKDLVASTTIAQTNVATEAAASAARSAGGAGGGGMSGGALIGIVGGIAAAGAGAAVAAGGSKDSPTPSGSTTPSTTTVPTATAGATPAPNPTTPTPTTQPPTTPAPPSNSAPVINSASISPSVALVGANTTIAFQVQASDADNDALTYLWEFPDGSTSDQRAFTRVFEHGGVYTIRVNVRDGRTSTSRELSLNMKTMIGGWTEVPLGNFTGHTFTLNQAGSNIFGTYKTNLAECPVTGSIGAGGVVTLQSRNCPYFFAPQGIWYELPSYRWEFQPSTDGDRFTGTIYVLDCRDCVSANWSGATSLRRQ